MTDSQISDATISSYTDWTHFVESQPGSFMDTSPENDAEREWVRQNELARPDPYATNFLVLESLYETISLMSKSALADAAVIGTSEAWQKAVALQASLYDIGAAMGYAAKMEGLTP
jgi:hypothetical protein